MQDMAWKRPDLPSPSREQLPAYLFIGLLFTIPIFVSVAMAMGKSNLAPVIVAAVFFGGALLGNVWGGGLMLRQVWSSPEFRQPDLVARILYQLACTFIIISVILGSILRLKRLYDVSFGFVYFAVACILFRWVWWAFEKIRRRSARKG